jgi:Domain of unknown function (DUF4129)
VNRAGLTLGLGLMDVCWAYPVAVLLGVWADSRRDTGLLSAATILVLLLLGAAATHVLGARVGRGRKARAALAGTAIVASLVTVRVEHYSSSGVADWLGPFLGALAATIGQLTAPVLAFALALYMFYRGVRLGSQTPGYTEIEGSFRWGIGRMAVLGLIIAANRRVEPQTTPFVVGFFFISLLTLALGRLESLRTRTRRPSLNTQWLAVLIVAAAGVVVLALLLGQIVSFDVLLIATRPIFDLLGAILLVLLYIIVIPLAYVVEWLVYLILALLQTSGPHPPPQLPQTSDVDNALQRFFAQAFSPELIAALKAGAAGLAVALALFVVARGLASWRPSSADADATNEERDSVLTFTQAWARLLAWLRGLLRRASPAPDAATGVPERIESSDAREFNTVRAIYAELLRSGEDVGVTRRVATTPLEHLPALTEALQPDAALRDLTTAYVRVRYAEAPATREELARLRAQLGEVRPIDAPD